MHELKWLGQQVILFGGGRKRPNFIARGVLQFDGDGFLCVFGKWDHMPYNIPYFIRLMNSGDIVVPA